MAYIAAADCTITWSDAAATPSPGDIVISGGIKLAFPKIAFGNAALQYPTGGIPLPAIGKFGMVRNINSIQVLTGNKPGVRWEYDQTNHKLLCYAHSHTVRIALSSADAAGSRLNASAADLWISEPSAGGADYELSALLSGVTSHGGVQATTLVGAHSLEQLADGNVPAATSLLLQVAGW